MRKDKKLIEKLVFFILYRIFVKKLYMAHFHEGSHKSTYLTHDCKRCGESTGHALHIDVEQPHLCDSCKLIEKRDAKLNSLLEDKKWWQIWK